MTTVSRNLGTLLVALLSAATVHAQQAAPSPGVSIQQTPSSQAASPADRPATTTFLGDSGVWFVPIAEVLPHRGWSATGYRRGTNYIQGYTSVADIAGTFAVGLGDRLEVFGSVLAYTTLDRDLQPVFVNDRTYGGFIDRYPRVDSTSPVSGFGDTYLGAKFNLLSEHRGDRVAAAVRTIVKLPTADDPIGAGTGKTDLSVEAIGSKEFRELIEAALVLGYAFQGQPTGFTTPTGAVTWGAAASYPSRSAIRIFGEAMGVVPSSDAASRTAPLVGVDGSVAPASANTENLTRVSTGLTWQTRHGFFIGAGISWTSPRQERIAASQTDHTFGDYRDWQVRIGFHPGVHPSEPQSTRR